MSHFPNQNQNLAALLQSLAAGSTPNFSAPAATAAATTATATATTPAPAPAPTPSSAPALANPSKITTWPAALKHVVKIASVNEELQAKIRRMIKTKHDHERKWWDGREALLAQQQSRAEKKREIDDVLKSIGAPSTPGHVPASEDDAKELQAYDRKVYTAYTTLCKVQHSELRAAGIPFFAIDPALVRHEEQAQTKSSNPDSTGHDQASDDSFATSQVSETDLKLLQQRIIVLLEDLCKE